MFAAEFPIGFEAGDEFVPFAQLHRRVAAGDIGRTLSGRTRFLTFKPEGISEAEWRSMVGVEADRLTHLHESWRRSKKFLAEAMEAGTEYSLRDLEDIQLACLMHDWPGLEADDLVQDVPSLPSALPEALRPLADDLGEEMGLSRRLEATIDDVFCQPGSIACETFLAIEALGYAELLRWAWKKAGAVHGSYQEHFRYFALRLFAALVPGLQARARHIPVRTWIGRHRAILRDIAGMSEADLRYFPPPDFPRQAHPKAFVMRFDAARDAWEGVRGTLDQ